jgi:ubiquinone/menaquinone biosynthesis C-methylase UbiE
VTLEAVDANALLSEAETAYPGLMRYLGDLARYHQMPVQSFVDRLAPGVRRLGRRGLLDECRRFTELGIFPDVDVSRDEQVVAIWQSRLMSEILKYALVFYPPPSADMRAHLPRPATAPHDVMRRPILYNPFGSLWEKQLALTAQEIYLEPFLRERRAAVGGRPLRGADLACGWGRGTFCLRERDDLHIECCDLSRFSLRILTRLLRNAGLSSLATPVYADVMQLPYADDTFDFFMVYDILEHLTDDKLERVLSEMLRVGQVGAILCSEIPLHSKCLALTHLQDFELQPVLHTVYAPQVNGKKFRLRLYEPAAMHLFTFVIEKAD